MFSKPVILKKYLHYWLRASNGKGHGTHSPFVFDFINKVLNDKTAFGQFEEIEKIRKELRNNHSVIEVEDFGAGSAVINTNKRRIDKIAASSLKPKKFAQLLFRIAKYYKPRQIIEIGTSFGITTSYLAAADSSATVHTHEGAIAIAAIAASNFNKLSLNNVHLKKGEFSETLTATIAEINKVDLAFVDGNHKLKPTLDYMKLLLPKCDENSIIIFDDIHWSEEMEKAWKTIKAFPEVTLSIDLFFIGIVFFRKDFKVPQHFTIRF